MLQHRRRLARTQAAAQVHLGTVPVPRCIIAHFGVFLRTHQRQSVPGVLPMQFRQQRLPVLLAPVLGLHLGPRTAHHQRTPCQRAQRGSRPLPFRRRQPQIPTGRIPDARIAQPSQRPRQPRRLRFKSSARSIQWVLQLFAARQPHHPTHAGQPEEGPVAPYILLSSHWHQVHQHIGPQPPNLPRQSQQLADMPRSHRVPHVALHQPGIAQHRGRGRRLRMHWEVRQQHSLGSRKHPLNQVEARQRHQGVSQAAQAIDQYLPDLRLRRQAASPHYLLNARVPPVASMIN